MKKTFKVLAVMLCLCLTMNICSCSSVQDFFSSDNSSNYSHKKDKKDKKDKKSKETESTEETDITDETEITDVTDVTETSADASISVSDIDLSDLPELTYPDHVYTYEEIHPKHDNGTVSGQEASDLLDTIEFEVLNEQIGSSYVDIMLLFDDPEAMGFTVPEPSWGEVDLSEESRIESLDFINEELAKLYTIDRDSLDTDDRIFYDKITYDLEESAYADKFSAFNYYTTALNPLVGPQCDLLFLLEVLSFDTVQEAKDYIELVKSTDSYYDSLCLFEEMRAAYGFASSDEIYEQIAESFDALYKQKDDCFLYDSFETRLDNINNLSEADRAMLISGHEDAMQNYFFPEFEECASRMRALKGSGGKDCGLCDMTGGDAYFDMLYRSQSNADYSIDEGIAELDKRLAEDMDEMNEIVNSGDFSWYSEYLNPGYTKGDTNANLKYLSVAILDDFDELPDHSYGLIDVPEALQENFSPAAYLGYHLDRMDDNLIITNPSNVDDSFGITCAHEGYPGHMYQSVYSRNICSHAYMYVCDPIAYAEGWATYVENFSFRYFASNEDASKLRQIENELNIILMARMDIGIHYEGWTIDNCCEYYGNALGYGSAVDASMLEDIYYIIVSDPCYAVKYGIGFINTTNIMDSVIEAHPDVDIQDIHMAYLNCQPGTFNQISENFEASLEERLG